MQQKPSLKRTKRTATMRPRVGVGVIVTRGNQVLLLRRGHSHGDGTWSVPGGQLECGEALEACAIREVKEEVGVTITDLAFRAVTNDLFEFERRHYVTIWMEGSYVSGEPSIQAPDEMSDVGWFSWDTLPEPLFLPLQHLKGRKQHMELIIDQVSKQYRTKWALRDLSLCCSSGIIRLVDPNGAGKTTLMRIIATLLQPTKGRISGISQIYLLLREKEHTEVNNESLSRRQI